MEKCDGGPGYEPPPQNHPPSASAATSDDRRIPHQFPLNLPSYPPVANIERGDGGPVYYELPPPDVVRNIATSRGDSAAAAVPHHSSVPPPPSEIIDLTDHNFDFIHVKQSDAVMMPRSNQPGQRHAHYSESTSLPPPPSTESRPQHSSVPPPSYINNDFIHAQQPDAVSPPQSSQLSQGHAYYSDPTALPPPPPYINNDFIHAKQSDAVMMPRSNQPGQRHARHYSEPTSLPPPSTASMPHHSSVPPLPSINNESIQAKKTDSVMAPRSNQHSQRDAHVSEPTSPPVISKTPLNLSNLICLAFTTLLSQPHLRNKWLTSRGIISMIKKRYAFTGDLRFYEAKFHTAILGLTKNAVDIQDETNTTGIFRVKRCNENKKNLWLYYVTDPGKPMGKLPVAVRRNPNFPSIKTTTEAREAKSTNGQRANKRKRPILGWHENSKPIPEPEEAKKLLQEAWEKVYKEAQEICAQELKRQDAKRQKIKDAVDCEIECHTNIQKYLEMETKALVRVEKQEEFRQKAADSVDFFCYFDSKEAKMMFRPWEGESVQDCLQRRIDFLEGIINNPTGYKEIVFAKFGKVPEPTLAQRHQIQHKTMVLRLSYIYALDLLEKGHSYAHCCKLAFADVRRITSLKYGSEAEAEAMEYNREFRETHRFQPPYERPLKSEKKTKQKKSAAK